jgi:pimeloyl-ACP methyl ester carboxylesterase
MKPLQTKLWWVVMPMMFALSLGAQSDQTDKSPHRSEFITVNGVRLHYLDWGGKGDMLLFLHGMADTAHRYDDFAPRFTNGFRVLGLTRRGHGESEVPETGYDTATLIEDIRQFLDALKIQRVVLAGHSFAGDELTRFAVAHPDRVIKLIYFDSAFDHSRVPESLRFKPLHGWWIKSQNGAATGYGGPELSPTKEESQSLEGRRRYISRLFGEKRGPAIYSMMEVTYSARAEYGKIKAPALAFFAVGYQEVVDWTETLPEPQRQNMQEFLKTQRKYHEQEIEHFRREIPNGRIIVFTNASHQFPLDREDEVLREMRAFLAPPGSHPLQTNLPVAVDLQVPMPPTPVKADGKWYLLYELNVTNLGRNNLELVRVEVLTDRAERPIATYTDEELSRRLKPGIVLTVVAEELRIEYSSDDQAPQVIGRGNRAVMYMLMTVQREADIPAALHHRLFFKSHSAENSEEVVIEGARVTVNRKAPLVLSPPLRGEGWVAAEGPSDDNHHRRNIFVIGGKARIPARFAIDWTRIGADGRLVHGDRANNANWYPYGAEVLAVANAVVADVKDGIPDNQGGTNKWNASLALGTNKRVSLEAAAGNYVMLDLGKSNFAVYAHLQPRSIRVHVGQKVRRGQVLGLLGNSGDSYSPHLHFHVANNNSLFDAEGVPYVFESFEVQGVAPITTGPTLDEAWKPPPNAKTDKRRMEIPTENAVIRFP